MSDVASTILLAGGTEVFDLLAPVFSQWAIYSTGTSQPVIEPDTYVDFEFIGDARISDYPVEQGAFANYNKVQVPRHARVKLACAGEIMSRGDFLDQLESMKESVDLYDLATPDGLFQSFTLTHYDYLRRSRNGVSMLVAELHFEEVRQTGTASYSATQNGSSGVQSNSPSANDPQNLGTVSAGDLSPAQQTVYNTGTGPL